MLLLAHRLTQQLQFLPLRPICKLYDRLIPKKIGYIECWIPTG